MHVTAFFSGFHWVATERLVNCPKNETDPQNYL